MKSPKKKPRKTKLRPIDIRGILPSAAAWALESQKFHAVPAHRLGAVVIPQADLTLFKSFTREERQAAEGCAGIVMFFEGFNLGEDTKIWQATETIVKFLARGVIDQTSRAVFYVGGYTNPTHTKLHWLGVPIDPKDWQWQAMDS